ncbi:MAG TPA: nitronate monooxygenase [Anaerolineales bacterium]
MKIQNSFTESLGIDYPIIGAPMFLVSYERYVIALAEAGALGTFPLPNYRTTSELKQALQNIREATSKPIGVNIHLSGRFPWKEQLALCLDAGVSFFISSLGNPALILDDVHANGGTVFADVIKLEQGLKARDRGVDGLIAVGAGAGGHCGTISTLVFTPYLAKKTGLPVIAAGGISTGEQMAAALAVGACGVVVGTRLIATEEAGAVQAYKQAVVEAEPEGIVTTAAITGHPASWLASSIADFQGQPSLDSKIWRDLWSAGQSVAQTDSIEPIQNVIREMADDYTRACHRLSQTILNV